jgi:hypothetical protein
MIRWRKGKSRIVSCLAGCFSFFFAVPEENVAFINFSLDKVFVIFVHFWLRDHSVCYIVAEYTHSFQVLEIKFKSKIRTGALDGNFYFSKFCSGEICMHYQN